MNDHGNLTDKRPPLLPTIIGTGLGSGFWPWGPGTAGSVVAVVIWLLLGWPLAGQMGTLQLITLGLIVVGTALGTWATARLQPYWGEDPSRVVIDEMVGVWIPLLVVRPDDYLGAFVALVLFRYFDIVKPFGIKALDRRSGAFWVMADDILGGVYALVGVILFQTIYKLLTV